VCVVSGTGITVAELELLLLLEVMLVALHAPPVAVRPWLPAVVAYMLPVDPTLVLFP